MQAGFGQRWQGDIAILTASIKEACPQWKDNKEDLFSHPEIVKAMTDNVEKHYPKIGPFCKELRRQLKLLRSLHSDSLGALLPKELLEEAANTITFGVETVAFTYIAWHVLYDLRGIENDAMRTSKITAIKKRVTEEHKVQLTSQMASILDSFAEGSFELEGLSLPSVSEEAVKNSVLKEPARDPPGEQAGEADEAKMTEAKKTEAPSQPPKRASLSDRLRAAKKLKV